jgi:hypothetical protein
MNLNNGDSSASVVTPLPAELSTPNSSTERPQLTVVRVRVTLRLAVYRQLVRVGNKPLETHDQHFFSTELLRS